MNNIPQVKLNVNCHISNMILLYFRYLFLTAIWWYKLATARLPPSGRFWDQLAFWNLEGQGIGGLAASLAWSCC